ncbi:hypothetical protein BCR36DRAFT_581342 [Piromyces finnis]|uniref:Uncharacterized protein n=1 Tax=Piromyces finnis TaxID=1754191 RepID=A0A1Y1VFV6_9FUNG|nr:hypothetical protein BCR36DRAFT_581342 [Piromyces finnis]|eukprot:ORX55305.1 hypothetical protein BCR36DRAFT_581342 [Piromyces finnis]
MNLTNIVVEKKKVSLAEQFIQNSLSSYTPKVNHLSRSNDNYVKDEDDKNTEIIIEDNSKFRIRTIPNVYKETCHKLSSIKYIPLKEIKRKDDPGKWYTLGVMVGKSSIKQTTKGDNYAMIQLGNLNNTITNIFIFGNNLKKLKDKRIGQVLAICHAKTMIPTEKNSSIALNIDSESLIYTLGKSIDLCFCKEKKKDGNPCNIPLDRRIASVCEYHTISKYKEFRNKRQEFANGNFRFSLEQNNQNLFQKSTNGTYKFKDNTISTFNGKLKLNQYNVKPQISEEDNKYLEKLRQNNSYGVHLLKNTGIYSKLKNENKNLDKKREENLLSIHPPEALLKMGIRAPLKKPINNKLNIQKPPCESKKEKEIILEFSDNEDSKKLLDPKCKRKVEISFLSDEEDEDKSHYKKFLERKNKKLKKIN